MKEYIDSVLNYTGSKYKLLPQLLPNFDYTKKRLIDLFTGGGSIFINSVENYDEILINDVISDLIGIHKSIIQSDDIINKTKDICPTKDDSDSFIQLRKSYNIEKTPEKLWALILSCNSNLIRFNQKGEFNQTFGKRGWNPNTDKKVEILINYIRNFKNKIKFNSSNFNDVPLLTDSFYYIDPPYGYIKDINGDIGNKQISEAGYNCF
jgi:DNA adenine methylase Dam